MSQLTLYGHLGFAHEHGFGGGVERGVFLPIVGFPLRDVLKVAHALVPLAPVDGADAEAAAGAVLVEVVVRVAQARVVAGSLARGPRGGRKAEDAAVGLLLVTLAGGAGDVAGAGRALIAAGVGVAHVVVCGLRSSVPSVSRALS